jgi:hypothetical protein
VIQAVDRLAWMLVAALALAVLLGFLIACEVLR